MKDGGQTIIQLSGEWLPCDGTEARCAQSLLLSMQEKAGTRIEMREEKLMRKRKVIFLITKVQED